LKIELGGKLINSLKIYYLPNTFFVFLILLKARYLTPRYASIIAQTRYVPGAVAVAEWAQWSFLSTETSIRIRTLTPWCQLRRFQFEFRQNFSPQTWSKIIQIRLC